MARASSIPPTLYGSIVKRWSMGESAEAIVKWIEGTNWRRTVPVKTSRSSVERFLERTELQNTQRPAFAVVSRLRRQAPAQLDQLEKLDAEYTQVANEADKEFVLDPENVQATKARFSFRLRTITRREMLAARRLRLAGLAGAGIRRWEADNASALKELAHDVEEETTADLFAEGLLEDVTEAFEELRETAAPPPPEPVADVRLEGESAGETGSNESNTGGESVAPPAAWLPPKRDVPVPLVRTPAWPLTPEQQAEWSRMRTTANTWLLIAYRQDAPNPAPEAAVDSARTPPEDLGARVVPLLVMPHWPMSPAQRQLLQEEVDRVNGWLMWLRRKINKDVELKPAQPNAANDELERWAERRLGRM